MASTQLGALAFRGGAESATGPKAPLRHAAIAGAGFHLEGWEAEGEVRLAPSQAGADGLSAELTARRAFDGATAAATLATHRSSFASCAACGPQLLSGTGAAAEVEVELASFFTAGLRAAAWRLELREPRTPVPARRPSAHAWQPGPWDRFGASTLDWPSRWEASLQGQGHWGPFSASLSGGLSAPPADGVLAARGTLKIECALGQATGAMTAGAARLTPTGQVLAELAVSLSVRFGGVP